MPPSSLYHARTPVTAEEEAYRYLLDAICHGRYHTGDRLIAEDIAGEIGMSRMPVREAFRRLAAEGLVTLRPNRGAIVSGLNLDEMREVFEMRSALEGLAVRLATATLTDRQLTTLERMLDDMDEVREDGAEWVGRHRAFHEYLCSLAMRPRLLRQISALYSVIEPHMRLWLQHVDKPLSARQEHAEILTALRSRNAALAERVVCEHIEGTVPALLNFLEAAGT
ncbi:GntR family transcriptional regulator [Pseudomonas japonica]|uniref:GntR family transcriptional regulator n=1 Tax=Pseudomonas japonica TaxID=256466 RepID=UPI0015E290A7|nr:GntR family transcriptional regulator [Pseudomonas japonica]MBA1242146.1 GntR family transcriptional regulator [Pseudomonas japonica]